MKKRREKKSSKQTPSNEIETFGGDYHRLESDFRLKDENAPAKLSKEQLRQAKAKRKKSA